MKAPLLLPTLLVAFLTSTVLPSASAALLVYEGFNYSLSNSSTLRDVATTGTGLEGNWTGGSDSTLRYQTTGLTYGNLITSGGGAFFDGSGTLDAALTTAVKNAVTPTDGQTTTVWMSFLAQRPDPQGNTTSTNFQGVALDRSASGSMNAITVNNPGTTLEARAGNATATAGTLDPAIALGETVFILGKFDFSLAGSTRSVTLTAYTFRDGALPTSESDLTGGVSSSDSAAFDRFPSTLRLIANFGRYHIDEIRVGLDDAGNTDFGGVIPIPEPSTYALFLGLGVVGVVLWRRRRTKA